MDNPVQVAAFDALVDRGFEPGQIDAETLQNEADFMDGPRGDVEAWRLSKTIELFYHVEFMVDRLRTLVAEDGFSDDNPEARETVRRLNLSARSIQHMSVPEDAATLMRVYQANEAHVD